MLFAIFGHLFTVFPISTTALKHSTLTDKSCLSTFYADKLFAALSFQVWLISNLKRPVIIIEQVDVKKTKRKQIQEKTWNEMKTHLSGRWRVRRHQAVQLFEDIRKLSADEIIEINVCRFFSQLLLVHSRAACLKRKSCPSLVSGFLQY